MRLFEIVDSDQQVIDLIKPILIRAKAEGADSVDLQQLLNDMGTDGTMTKEMMIDLINRHRQSLKNIIVSANLDSVKLNKGPGSTISTKADQQQNKFNSIAVNQAMGKLK